MRLVRLRFRGGGLVKLGAYRLPDFVQLLARGLDRGGITALERFLHGTDGAFNLALVVAGNFVRVVLEHFLGAVDCVVSFVAALDFLAVCLVLVRVRLGVLAHLLNFLLGETAAGRDGDLLFLAGAEVFRADVQDAVGVNVKRHLDLRHASRRRRNVRELELAGRFVVLGKLAFALQDVNLHAGLVVAGGRENF